MKCMTIRKVLLQWFESASPVHGYLKRIYGSGALMITIKYISCLDNRKITLYNIGR